MNRYFHFKTNKDSSFMVKSNTTIRFHNKSGYSYFGQNVSRNLKKCRDITNLGLAKNSSYLRNDSLYLFLTYLKLGVLFNFDYTEQIRKIINITHDSKWYINQKSIPFVYYRVKGKVQSVAFPIIAGYRANGTWE